MNLQSKFEPVRAALMNRENSPDLDMCIQEVLREKTHLSSTHSLTEEPKALLTQPAPSSADETTMFITRGQKLQCYECKKYGHVARDCRSVYKHKSIPILGYDRHSQNLFFFFSLSLFLFTIYGSIDLKNLLPWHGLLCVDMCRQHSVMHQQTCVRPC